MTDRPIEAADYASRMAESALDAAQDSFRSERLASAPPAAATVEVPDERKAFEAWWDVNYCGNGTLSAWKAWQARAALSTPTAQKAEGGEVPTSDVRIDLQVLHQVKEALKDMHSALEALSYGDSHAAQDGLDAIASINACIGAATTTPAAAAGVPPGMVLVPREPTIEMKEAALQASRREGPVSPESTHALPVGYELWSAELIYRAMLAASGATQQEKTDDR